MIEFRTFGGLDLRGDELELREALLAKPKHVALLAYLCIARPRGFHRRDTLVAMFWPEADQAHARTSLRNALHGLRRALGANTIVSRGDEEVAVNFTRLWCDAAAFADALGVPNSALAADLYRGDLLPGLFLPNAADFERWLDEERMQLRQAAAHATCAVAESRASGSDDRAAVTWTRRALTLIGKDESALRRLLLLFERVGNHAEALAAYEEFARRLQMDLDAAPSAETTAVADRLRARSAVLARDHSGPKTVAPNEKSDSAVDRPQATTSLNRVRRVALSGAVAALGVYTLLGAIGIVPFWRPRTAAPATRQRILVAELSGNDTALSATVTELARSALELSPRLSILPPTSIRDALQRTRRPTTTRVDEVIAVELAVREGLRRVVTGNVISFGGRTTVSMHLVEAKTGERLASVSGTATAAAEMVNLVGRLSRELRSHIGEPNDALSREPSLDRVTTASFEAFRKFAQASYALDYEMDRPKGFALLEDAIALDSTFSMAYRKLAVYQKNTGALLSAQRNIALAHKYADRLSDYERHMTRAAYYEFGPRADPHRAIPEYQAIIDDDSTRWGAINNLALLYADDRDFARAESLETRAWHLAPLSLNVVTVLYRIQVAQGEFVEAERTLVRFDSLRPANDRTAFLRRERNFAKGLFDSVAATAEKSARRALQAGLWPSDAALLASVETIRGHLSAASRWRLIKWRPENENHDPAGRIGPVVDEMLQRAYVEGDDRGAARVLDRALAAVPLDSVPEIERPYEQMVQLYAFAGRTSTARRLMTHFDRTQGRWLDARSRPKRSLMLGHVALAEHRYADAIRAYRAADVGPCVPCALPHLAHAYDLSGETDSALAVLTRYVEGYTHDFELDAVHLPHAIERLGQLWYARGNVTEAKKYNERFAELWRNADADLLPRMRQARERTAKARTYSALRGSIR